jgi:hypothetical protein
MDTRPDVAPAGTVAEIEVVVADVTDASVTLNASLSLVGRVSKLMPSTVTAAPAAPIVGVKPVIDGAPKAADTVKGVLLVADPDGVVTAIDPLVAAAGTVATSCVVLADTTVAGVPLNVTAFWAVTVLKPVP